MTEGTIHPCTIEWQGNTRDYESFPRLHQISFPSSQKLSGGAGGKASQATSLTNPEELFAAALGTCLMMTVLAVFCKSQINVVAYRDKPEALLEFVDRRFRVTKVFLHPTITVEGDVDREKFENLVKKAHANCFIAMSIKSEVVIEPIFQTVI